MSELRNSEKDTKQENNINIYTTQSERLRDLSGNM